MVSGPTQDADYEVLPFGPVKMLRVRQKGPHPETGEPILYTDVVLPAQLCGFSIGAVIQPGKFGPKITYQLVVGGVPLFTGTEEACRSKRAEVIKAATGA